MPNRYLMFLSCLLLVTFNSCDSGPEQVTNKDSNVPKVSLPGRNTDTGLAMLLRTINTAQMNHRTTAGRYGTLKELVDSNLVDGSFSSGERSGYKFDVEPTNGGDGFTTTAVPVQYGVTGTTSFYSDESGVIRGADKNGEKAGSEDPQIQ
jgi:hypothetical protein